jgi:hypothetical protein
MRRALKSWPRWHGCVLFGLLVLAVAPAAPAQDGPRTPTVGCAHGGVGAVGRV